VLNGQSLDGRQRTGRIRQNRFGDDLAGIANVIAIVTAETTRRIKMADIVRVSFPVRFHLREEVWSDTSPGAPAAFAAKRKWNGMLETRSKQCSELSGFTEWSLTVSSAQPAPSPVPQ